ncbi:aromatic acid/H+ symport family MFS transporter [Brevundimonas sp. 3P9-tot-E]|jgi:MFS transporter, AAHS family, benzoate transport protein|uniref:MFS transporter n=1 Tax=Brevundimonas TaxID=41275 RepID=UPI002898A5E9|nr:aromatic acid/H+ symport family MFS transporter [Brevundimonas diminuta]
MGRIHVNETIDAARFGKTHWLVVALCGLLLIVDGYDVFIYGAVLPQLMDQWDLTPPQAGSLASWALFGMMFGALFFGPLGDRIGRKKSIALCFVIFSLATILNGLAETPLQFGVMRFFAGLGCGGLMPNAVALTNEYAPKRLRSTLVALMFSGYAVGGMAAAGLGIWMLPEFGWRSMFFAAAVPLATLPLLLWLLPESLGFLVRQGKQTQARALLARIAPDREFADGDELIYDDTKGQKAAISALFSGHRAIGTIALWVCFFCCLLMVYALSSWLPQLMRSAGYSLGSSLSFLLALSFGGMFGAIAGGRLADRFGLPAVVIGYFALGAICISLLGFKSPMAALYVLIFIAGAGTTGTQILLYASVAEFYALSVRSTGLGWASGVGRIGAIVGPLLGGVLLAAELPMTLNFMAFAVPGLISVLAMVVFLGARRRAVSPDIAPRVE